MSGEIPLLGLCPICNQVGARAPVWPYCCHAHRQRGALCDLLADARDLIAEHISIEEGIEWMERLHREPAFVDPNPPNDQGDDQDY